MQPCELAKRWSPDLDHSQILLSDEPVSRPTKSGPTIPFSLSYDVPVKNNERSLEIRNWF